jgi:flagellar biosynthesis/type III secretory pathway chaperone
MTESHNSHNSDESYFGLHWSKNIDQFFKSVEETCKSYKYSSLYNKIMVDTDQYERNVIAEMDIIIKYGCLKITWTKRQVNNHDDILLEDQTERFTNRLSQLSKDTENECNNICYNCGITPAFTEGDQCGGFSTLCPLCRCESDLYKRTKVQA